MAESGAEPEAETPAAQLPPPGTADVLYLVDISGYIFRAFFALPPLTSETGEPTGALMGVTTMLLKLVRECQPGMLAVVMDAKGPSMRKQEYSEYKANRPPAPDDLKFQMGKVREIAEAYGMPVYEQSGYEADDLIASLTREAKAHGHRVVIVSADKDLLQLVGDDVLMFDSMRDRVFGRAETIKKMGVPPEQVRDLLAFMGDSSDNVPGVPKVGAKTAASLLQEYGSMDNVYEHLDEITKKALKKNLTEHRDLAELSRQLVSLRDEVPVEYDAAALKYGGEDAAKLAVLFKRYNFTRLLGQVDASDGPPEPSAAAALEIRELRVVTDAAELPVLATAIVTAGRVSIATVSDGEDPIRGGVCGLALAFEDEAVYLPVGHSYLGCPEQLSGADVVAALGEVLADANVQKLSANSKRDRLALRRLGTELNGIAFDAMLASYLLDPDLRGHGAVQIALRAFATEVVDYAGVAGKGKSQVPISETRFEDAARYAGALVQVVPAVHEQFSLALREAGLADLLGDMELPLAGVLATVESHGVGIDVGYLQALGHEVEKDIVRLEKRCHELAGREFNVASPRQLETILFDELDLPVVSRTKTARSTKHDVLEELAAQHPLPAVILEHRSLAKLKSTYLDALPREVLPRTGRIHTRFDQAVAATGRLSSNEPNLQNIPIRTEVGRRIREAFIAPEGWGILSADYSQIELRVLAHLSGDRELVDAFGSGEDVHVRTATALFGISADEVDRDQRAAAKTVNFAVIYGQTQFALARNLRISRPEASRYIKAFFERYEGVRTYLDGLVVGAKETGEVRTLLGRRRKVKDIAAKNHSVRGAAERIAKNAPIQGSAADIMKIAMLRAQDALDAAGLKARMVLTVHDELVFEAPAVEREQLDALVREAMEGAFELQVPLVVETGWGDNWGEAH